MVYFSNDYYQAMVNGDLSGSVVHPFFIHFANLAGCHIYQQHQRKFSLLATEAIHLRLTLAELEKMEENDDPIAFATAYTLMAIASFLTRMYSAGLGYMEMAVMTLKSHGVDLCSVNTALDSTSRNHQKSVLLLTLLYTETLLQMVFGCGQGLTSEIEHQFIYELPVRDFSTNALDPRLYRKFL